MIAPPSSAAAHRHCKRGATAEPTSATRSDYSPSGLFLLLFFSLNQGAKPAAAVLPGLSSLSLIRDGQLPTHGSAQSWKSLGEKPVFEFKSCPLRKRQLTN